MPYKKYLRKTARKGVKFAKSRYATRTGGARVSRIARDVMTIKRSLNVEHKHLDYKIGSSGNIVAQKPTKQNPVIIALNTPIRGTSFNNRVGNQIRVVHMTAKYQFTFHNNTDLIQRQNVRARIIWAKNADHVPVISNLLDADANGHYTDQSFINTQEYKKFLWLKALDTRQSYTQPTNRYPGSRTDAKVYDTAVPGASEIIDNVSIGDSLNIANFFKRAETKCSIRTMFANGTDDVEQMKPYLLLTSDIIEANPTDYDEVDVSAVIRMTYVDN